jgi:hypothetical protein
MVRNLTLLELPDGEAAQAIHRANSAPPELALVGRDEVVPQHRSQRRRGSISPSTEFSYLSQRPESIRSPTTRGDLETAVTTRDP